MQAITVMVETPKGSGEKYDYDAANKWFKLKKILPAGMVFPFDFGFVPDTKGADGDPLDVLIISEFKSFPGCVIDCRIIGGITAEQTEKNKTIRNDRFIVIPEASQLFSNIKTIKDMPRELIKQLETFFINYNELEGKKFKPLKRINAQQSLKMIKSKLI